MRSSPDSTFRRGRPRSRVAILILLARRRVHLATEVCPPTGGRSGREACSPARLLRDDRRRGTSCLDPGETPRRGPHHHGLRSDDPPTARRGRCQRHLPRSSRTTAASQTDRRELEVRAGSSGRLRLPFPHRELGSLRREAPPSERVLLPHAHPRVLRSETGDARPVLVDGPSGRPRVDRCAEPTGTSIDSTLRQRHRDKRNRARSDPPLLRARREGDPSARRNAPVPVPGARRLLARREPLVPGEAGRVSSRGLPSTYSRATRPSRRARSGGYGGTVWGPPPTAAA